MPDAAAPADAMPDGMSMMAGRFRRLARNTFSILTSEVVNRASVFLLYALVARYLGATEFGQLALALALFYTFQVLAIAGLKTLVTREVAKDRALTGRYLVNGSLLVGVASLVSLAILAIFARFMGYTTDTAAIVLLLGAGLLPYALAAICEAIFQSWERMHYITLATVPVNVAIVGLSALALHLGNGLFHVIALILGGYLAVVVIEWWLMLTHIVRPRLQVDLACVRSLGRSTTVFFGFEGLSAINASVSVVLLARLTDEASVGIYSAAAQLMVPVMLLYHNLVLSVFPIMCRRFGPSPRDLGRIAEQLIELLLAIAVPAVVGLLLLAEPILLLLYGDPDFLPAATVLRLLVWNLVMVALTAVIGRVLLASMQEKVTLRIVLVNFLINLVLSLVLIGQFGLIGAAVATVITNVVNLLQHIVPVATVLRWPVLVRLAWKPVVAAGLMAALLTAVSKSHVLVVVGLAGLVYIAVLLVLMAGSSGGIRGLAARYSIPWAE
jgi:O-antigen/teichoic acid export membrane protein